MNLKLGTLVDRYTVGPRLGEGGMAVVYKVRHNTLESLHALKVLTLSSPGLPARLLREGQVQANLHHPNVVTVTDVIDVNGSPGLVMEYVEGPNLFDLLRSRALTLDEVDALARAIIGGVAAAHAKGLVHRDLKPANILMETGGGRLVPKITDFGIAKLLAGDGGNLLQTRTGTMMGTPRYMAPEQIRDAKNVGPEADVFSLGAILHEMVTGQQAFQGNDLYEIFTAVAEGRRTAVRDLVPGVPERMEAAIASALRVDPAARCRDCRELLALWDGEKPAAARPAPRAVQPAQSTTPPDLLESRSSVSPRSAPPPPPPPAEKDPAPHALALGLVLGGGGAAVVGIGALGVAAFVAVGWWASSGPEVEAVAEAAVAEAVVEVPPPPIVEPEPVAPAPRPAPSTQPVVSVAAPAVAVLPADLDPATTSADHRATALKVTYRSDPSATAAIYTVMRRDPTMSVRIVAAEMLRQRVRDGVDRAPGLAAVTWGARHAEPGDAKAKCLRAIGDQGDKRAGAIIVSQLDDPNRDVREAAHDACEVWLTRNPDATSVAAACAAATKTIADQLDEGVTILRRLTE